MNPLETRNLREPPESQNGTLLNKIDRVLQALTSKVKRSTSDK
jgi:hypothetical protein